MGNPLQLGTDKYGDWLPDSLSAIQSNNSEVIRQHTPWLAVKLGSQRFRALRDKLAANGIRTKRQYESKFGSLPGWVPNSILGPRGEFDSGRVDRFIKTMPEVKLPYLDKHRIWGSELIDADPQILKPLTSQRHSGTVQSAFQIHATPEQLDVLHKTPSSVPNKSLFDLLRAFSAAGHNRVQARPTALGWVRYDITESGDLKHPRAQTDLPFIKRTPHGSVPLYAGVFVDEIQSDTLNTPAEHAEAAVRFSKQYRDLRDHREKLLARAAKLRAPELVEEYVKGMPYQTREEIIRDLDRQATFIEGEALSHQRGLDDQIAQARVLAQTKYGPDADWAKIHAVLYPMGRAGFPAMALEAFHEYLRQNGYAHATIAMPTAFFKKYLNRHYMEQDRPVGAKFHQIYDELPAKMGYRIGRYGERKGEIGEYRSGVPDDYLAMVAKNPKNPAPHPKTPKIVLGYKIPRLSPATEGEGEGETPAAPATLTLAPPIPPPPHTKPIGPKGEYETRLGWPVQHDLVRE